MDNPFILITGALTGIGRAAAVAFANKVVVAGRRDEAGRALVEDLRSLGSEAEFINADVRKEGDVRALVDKTVGRFGRLDVAVNNAGTEGKVGPITDQTAETYGHEGAAGASVYVGSKHAVAGISKSVALEIADSGIPRPTSHRSKSPIRGASHEQRGHQRAHAQHRADTVR